MAGAATVGALHVDLSMATASYKGDVSAAEALNARFVAGFDRHAKNIAKAGAALGAALGAGIVAVGYNVRNAINEIDGLAKSAMKLGVPIEQLSKLKYVADLTDVSFDSLGTGIKKLSVNMAAMASGEAAGAVENAFKALGISVTDASGKLKSSEQVLLELSDKFAAMPDGAQKTALAIQLFGKSGADLIPMLNEGSKAIGAMTQKAEDLGLVITEEAAKAADDFNDNLTKLDARFDALWRQIATQVLPHLISLSEKLIDLIGDGKDLAEALKSVGTVFLAVAEGAITAAAAARQFGQGISGTLEYIDLFTRGEHEAATARWTKMLRDMAESGDVAAAAIRGLWKAAEPPPGLGFGLAKAMGGIGVLADGGGAGSNSPVEPTKPKGNSSGNRATQIRDETAAKREQLSVDQMMFAQIEKISAIEEYNNSIRAIELSQLAELNSARYLTIEQFGQLNTLWLEGGDLAAAYQDAILGVGATMDSEFERVANNIGSNLKRIEAFFKDTANRSSSQWLAMGDAMVDTLGMVFGESKELAIAQTLINTAQAVMKTLAEYGGTPWGWAAAAAVAAMGAAQIAKIASTNEGGGGGGGAAPVPAGGGGGGAGGGGGGAPLTQTMVVKGFRGDEFYSGDSVRSLVEELLQYQRDGGRIILDKG